MMSGESVEQGGKDLSLDEGKEFWQGKWLHPKVHPLSHLAPQQIEQLKAEFRSKIVTIATEQGV